MSQSVFTLILQGKLPCYKIYEDEHTLAFLTRDAIQPGHTLIIPKIEIDYFIDVPEPYYSAVFFNAKMIAQAIQKVTGCVRVGTVIAGWDIPHFHYHLIPMNDSSDLSFSKARQLSHEENADLQKRITEALNTKAGS